MSRVPFGNDPSKIRNYRAFWNREDVRRPLVAFTFKTWYPLQEYAASAAWQPDGFLIPDMVDPEVFMGDEEHFLREGAAVDDDVFRGAAPSQAIPWLDGMLGSRMHVLPGSVLAEEQDLSWKELERIHLDQANPWFMKYMEFVEALIRRSAGRFAVSHGTLPGPSDLAGTLRGRTQSIVDLLEEPGNVSTLLWKLAGISREINDEVWKRVPLFHGGYFDAEYQLWSPTPIFRMQEDATALYSPRLYRKLLQAVDRELAGHYSSSFIHLHSTSMFILDSFLEIEQIRCFQVNNDVGGPPIEDMVPYFQMIQRAKRPLIIRGYFSPHEASVVGDCLEPCGLYMYIMVKSMKEVDTLRPILGM